MIDLYQPNLKGVSGIVPSADNQKIAHWQELNYGMFIHWGLYSEIGGVWKGEPVKKGYSEQIQMWANISESDYLEVAHQFTAEKFDADKICLLAKEAGMKYVQMTTKHHDGFCMYETETTDYNIVKQTPYGQDPLKLLAEACERHGLEFGIYYSLVDWHQGHPFDEDNNNPIPAQIEHIIEKQLTELLTNYGPICEIWFDMSAPTLEQSRKFMEIVREYQPNAMINSRIWNNMGDFRTLDDNEVPSVDLDVVWQTPASIYRETWGYREWQVRDDFEGKVKELLKGLVGDGNYLLNIGPRGDGSVVEFEEDVLQEVGAWLRRHPSMTKACTTLFDKQPWGKVKYANNKLYLIIEEFPTNGQIVLKGLLNEVKTVVEEGCTKEITWHKKDDELSLTIPTTLEESVLPVIEVQLNEEPKMIPQKSILLKEGQGQLKLDDFYLGYGYHEQGNYNSMRQVIVRYTSYVLKEKDESIFLRIHGKANADKMYQVTLGDKVYELNGEQLVSSKIGPYQLEADQITSLSITLMNPTHKGEPLELDLDEVDLFV